MRRGWIMACALAGWLGSAVATPSLFAPRVTLTLSAVPLSEALAALGRQTGLVFELAGPAPPPADPAAPAAEPAIPAQRQPLPRLESVRARLDPEVSLQVTDRPLAEVLEALANQTGFRFGAASETAWRVTSPPPPDGEGGLVGPQALARDWLVSLAAIRFERWRELRYGPDGGDLERQLCRLTLRIEAPSELARFALLGVAPEPRATLDGQPLAALAPPGPRYPAQPANDGVRPAVLVPLEFSLPDTDGRLLEQFTGHLELVDGLREQIFDCLPGPAQQQSAGDLEVTLTPSAPDGADAAPAWLTVTIGRPPSDSFAAPAGAPGDWPAGLLGGLTTGPWAPPGGRVEAPLWLTPRVALEFADGSLQRLPAVNANHWHEAGRQLTAARFRLPTARPDAATTRIWIAALAARGATTQVPFVLPETILPPAAAPGQ